MATSISAAPVRSTEWAPLQRTAPTTAAAAPGVVAQAVTSPSREGLTPLPQDFFAKGPEVQDTAGDSIRRFLRPGYQSAGDKQKLADKIRGAAEKLRQGTTGGFDANRRLAGMSLEDARKLADFARTTKDAELIREADFVVTLLTDMRPSLDATPVDPGQQRTIPTQRYLGGSTQGRCAAAVNARGYREGLRGDNLVREVIRHCGAGSE